MEETAQNGEIIAQDDIDALFEEADTDDSDEQSEEPSEQPDTQEEVSTGNELLGQDDIDALLAEAGNDQEPEDTSVERDPLELLSKPGTTSDEDVRTMSMQIYNQGYLVREKGVKVLWNALGTLPMNSGTIIHIQGKEYTSLGILNERHLVVSQSSQ